MKLVVLTAVAVSCSASILSKSRAPKSLAAEAPKAPRKLSLFVRTEQVHCGGQFPCNSAPLFDSEALPVPIQSLMGGRQDYEQAPPPPPAAQGGGDCHPKCWWSCGTADCDETCDPVCAPPQCETACAQINLAACRQRCEPPKCAIVCPTQHCEHGGCPACKTVCAPPKCKTECSEQCESKCADPQCTWKCNPGKCEKPRCSLTCGGAKACGLDGNLNARPPPFNSGMTVLSKGLAATDPKTLSAFAAKGASPGAKKMPAPGAKSPAKEAKGKIR
jgi:hypothetical protein